MENVYNYLKTNHHANRFYEILEDVKANVRLTWQALVNVPDRMAKVGRVPQIEN